jgi:hypothetical protein
MRKKLTLKHKVSAIHCELPSEGDVSVEAIHDEANVFEESPLQNEANVVDEDQLQNEANVVEEEVRPVKVRQRTYNL